MILEKSCNKCGELKDIVKFDNSKHSKDGKYTICKKCKRAAYSNWASNNSEKIKINEHKRNIHRRMNIRETMFDRVRRRCIRSNIEFTITLEDIFVPEFCPILKFKLQVSNNKSPLPNSPSLDRIDPTKGYIPGNVQVISQKANTMKSNATLEELELFAKWILERKNNNDLHKS